MSGTSFNASSVRFFDIISLNETKIDCNSPDPIVSAFYNVIRRDICQK